MPTGSLPVVMIFCEHDIVFSSHSVGGALLLVCSQFFIEWYFSQINKLICCFKKILIILLTTCSKQRLQFNTFFHSYFSVCPFFIECDALLSAAQLVILTQYVIHILLNVSVRAREYAFSFTCSFLVMQPVEHKLGHNL